MMKSRLLLPVLALTALVGCIPLALHPFYSDQDVTFDAALLGTWGEAQAGPQVRFDPSGKDAYTMIGLEADTIVTYDVHLFTLAGVRFLDIYPRSTGPKSDGLLDALLIRGHSLVRVDRIDSSLVTAGFSGQWLRDLLSKDATALPHVISDDQLVLTATTAELRAFVLKHAADSSAFESPSEVVRMSKK